jgi:hypothetical protein
VLVYRERETRGMALLDASVRLRPGKPVASFVGCRESLRPKRIPCDRSEAASPSSTSSRGQGTFLRQLHNFSVADSGWVSNHPDQRKI